LICFAGAKPAVGGCANYVTICASDGSFKVGDQFGGQLLHIFSVLAFAWDNGLVPYFSRELLQNAKGASINYPLFFYRLNQDLHSDIDKSDLIHIRERCPYAPLGKSEMNKVQYAPYSGRNVCMCLAGVYPFFHHRDRLRNYFSPLRSIKIYLNQKYKHIIEHRKTVAVHVRTFHPALTLPLFLGSEYYKNAMDQFSDDHLFVVFSDRIEWAKENLEGMKPNMIFIKEENHILEFYLMTYCLNHIISNSNFSHLAAFLKINPSGITFVPEICHSDGHPKDYEDWFFPGCIALPVKPLSAPNWDLLNYPTTSIDEGGRPY
jgi:hypothetical protein